MSKTKIDGKAVRQIRKALDMKQQTLAEAVGADTGTISRIERGKIKSIRPGLFEKLREALKTDRARLGGDRSADANKAPMQLSIDEACRNAMFLVAYRYRVTVNEIVATAPLCFHLLAELSLRQRERLLRKTEEHLEKIAPNYRSMEAGSDLAREEKSIRDRNLGISGDLDYDFVDFLRELLAKLSGPDPILRWTDDGPRYEICKNEASAIVGGDSEAAQAILSGTVALRKVPAAIRKSAGPPFAAWVKNLQRESASAGTDDVATTFEHPGAEAIEIDIDDL